MKKLMLIAASALLMLGLAGCSDLNDRVDQLESDVQELQSAIKTLQAAVDAKLTITGVTPTENGNIVTFSDKSTLTITNGKDGKDGKDGVDGVDGDNGKDGDTLIGKIVVENGYAYITLADGTSFYFPVYSPVGAVKALVFVPEYTDGKATADKNGMGRLKFYISPASAFAGLEEAYNKQEVTPLLTILPVLQTRDGEEEEEGSAYEVKFDSFMGTVEVTNIDLSIAQGSDIAISFILEDQFSSVQSEFLPVVWDEFVEYGGVKYSAKKMRDGKVWMTENLRYLPEGYTPSDDVNNVTAGVYYPLVLNYLDNVMQFSKTERIIEEQGYLYQSEVALGLKVGDIQSEEKAKSLEGVQGICPKGWHIPTADDIMGLVGKAVSPFVTNENAPYYDAEKKNASIELLNSDGFNFHPYGAVTIAIMSTKKASLMGYLKSNPGEVTSGYYCGSTWAATSKDKSGNVTTYQFLGIMPMANNGTANGSKLSHRIGASVRCVKNS